MASRSFVGLALSLALLGACSTDTVAAETGNTTTAASESSGAETETGWQPETETETGGEPDVCVCDPGQVCVTDCEPGSLGIPGTDPMQINIRCVDDPACLDDPHALQCVHDHCGHELGFTNSCGNNVGADLICAASVPSCDPGLNDCPDREKCSVVLLELSQEAFTKCVPILGDQPAGAPCSSEGFVTAIDDCDHDSVCFDAALSPEPFEATCKATCAGYPGDPDACPAGSTCTVIPDSEGWFVCLPD